MANVFEQALDLGEPKRLLIFGAIAILGAVALGIIALHQGESISAVWMVVAAVCTYAIAYRFYSRYLANKVIKLNPARLTPAMRRNDGLDYVPTDRRVLFGHHFAAIAGAGPLVGPVLAAQMGYLPGTLWLIAGVVLVAAGALRLGRVVVYIPWPVIEGFTAGIALIIALQQVPLALGTARADGENAALVALR
mgnify:CR=1 FL=1